MPPSVISSQSMHLGVLATASHAITTQTLFLVYYKPRFNVFLSRPVPFVLYGRQFAQYVVAFLFLCLMPLTRTSQFIIGLNKYLEAVKNGFSVGKRFKMRFEGEESPERRYSYYSLHVLMRDYRKGWLLSL